jgi:hypothetical protein
MPCPCPAPTVLCPSWNSAWQPEISELLVQQFNRAPFFVVCFYHSFPRPWQTLFGFTLVTCIWDWYASDINLCGTPRGSRKKPKVSRSPTGRLSSAVLSRGLEKNGMFGAGHGRCMASVNQTRPHCVNEMGKKHSKRLRARHGRGTALARLGCGMGTACYVWIGFYCYFVIENTIIISLQEPKKTYGWPCSICSHTSASRLIFPQSLQYYRSTVPAEVINSNLQPPSLSSAFSHFTFYETYNFISWYNNIID